MKRLKIMVVFWLCSTFGAPTAMAETSISIQPPGVDFFLWHSQLEFRGKKWLNKIEFRFENQVVAGGDREIPLPGSPVDFQEQSLFRLRLKTDLDPLVGPDVNLSDTAWINASTLAAERQLRTRFGRDDTYKFYRFTEKGVSRLRREPRGDEKASASPATWTDTKETFYPFPSSIDSCGPISTPAVLLPLASSLVSSKFKGAGWICIFDRKHTFRVYVEPEPLPSSQTDALNVEITGRGKVRMGSSGVVRVRFNPQPLEKDSDESTQFSFGGLTGEVFILVDRKTSLPYRIAGEVSGFGRVEMDLRSVKLATAESEPGFDDK